MTTAEVGQGCSPLAQDSARRREKARAGWEVVFMAGPDMLPTSSDVGLRQPILPERPRILNHVRRDQRAHEGHPLVGLRDAEQILVIPDIDGVPDLLGRLASRRGPRSRRCAPPEPRRSRRRPGRPAAERLRATPHTSSRRRRPSVEARSSGNDSSACAARPTSQELSPPLPWERERVGSRHLSASAALEDETAIFAFVVGKSVGNAGDDRARPGGVDGIEHLAQLEIGAVVPGVARHHVAALRSAELPKERVQGSRIVLLPAEPPDPPAVQVKQVVKVEPQPFAAHPLPQLGDVPIYAFAANEGANDLLLDLGVCHGRRDPGPAGALVVEPSGSSASIPLHRPVARVVDRLSEASRTSYDPPSRPGVQRLAHMARLQPFGRRLAAACLPNSGFRDAGFMPSGTSASNPAVHELPEPASRAREAPDEAGFLAPHDAPVELGLTAGKARSADLGTRRLLADRGRNALRDALSLSRKGMRRDDRDQARGTSDREYERPPPRDDEPPPTRLMRVADWTFRRGSNALDRL